MNCEEAKTFLNPLLDDELDVEKTASVGQHLEICPECQKQWAALSTLKEQSKAFREDIAIPEGMEARLRARVAKEFRPKRFGILSKTLIMSAAATLLMVFVVYLYLKPPALAQVVTVGDIIDHSQRHAVHHHGAPSAEPMSSKMGFTLKIDPMPGFQFEEADCCDLGDAHCLLAHLTYSRMVDGQEQQLSCYQMRKGLFDGSQLTAATIPGMKMGKVGAMSVMLLDGSESDTVVVSSMPPEDLCKLGVKLRTPTSMLRATDKTRRG